jgi:hypothetical protein
MDEYIKKLEEENSKLTALLGKQNPIEGRVMPCLDNLLLTFGLQWTFDGRIEGYTASIRHLYVNELTGSEEDKEIKTYKCEAKNTTGCWTISDTLTVGGIIRELDSDLDGFYKLRIFDFKVPWRTTEAPAPWLGGEAEEFRNIIITSWNPTGVEELFHKGGMYTIKPLKRVTRWTRFRQFVRGL